MKIGNKAQTYTHYNIVMGGALVPSPEPDTTKNIPPGIYMILHDQNIGDFLYPKEVNFETILDLPGMPTAEIMKNLNKFWLPETKAKYAAMGLTYKRGVLIHGSPGTGKTMCVIKVAQQFINSGGIVIFNPGASSLHNILAQVRDIEPDLKVLVVWEEFDEWKDDSELLSLLDGELQTDNIVYIGTTNFIDKIPDRIKNRPSRFAEKIEVKFPTQEDRKTYLSSKLTHLSNKELDNLAKETKGLVIDQIKDVVISTQVFDLTLTDALAKARSYNLIKEENETDLEAEEEELYEKLKLNKKSLFSALRQKY